MTKQEKKSTMFGMVEQWQESGISQAAFAQSQNITLVKFRYWIQKHRQSQESGSFIQLNGFSSSCGISIRNCINPNYALEMFIAKFDLR